MRAPEVRVLLVEDIPVDVELRLHALQQHAVTDCVQVAWDGGEDVVDVLFCRGRFPVRSFTGPPRLVVFDLKLRNVDGLEVPRQLKADPRMRPIPVVMLTSSKVERDLASSHRPGVNSCIEKPVHFTEFRETVTPLGLYWLLKNQPPPPRAFSTEMRP